ncbi:MAG: glutamate 5-kinase [Firmicutes bacterium]|nr:glutamate 5-kinase [Bacillota bacterium]
MDRKKYIKECKRVVIKVGTTSLTYLNGKINISKIDRLARVITDITNSGKEVILVSSGAIAVGSDRLNLEQRPRDTIGKQAASAVGQVFLIQLYERMFAQYNRKVAQILLTRSVFDNDVRKKNAGNTIDKLLELGVVPIVNANDTVTTDELTEFSDNDTLSAYVAVAGKANLLVILSDIDALYTADPNKDPDARKIDVVEEVDDTIYSIAGDAGSKLGTGGMVTKVKAAALLMKRGIGMVIASGNEPNILYDILGGKSEGTFFAKNNE